MRKLTTLPPSCAFVMKSGNLNFLEPSELIQACNESALPFIMEKSNDSLQCKDLKWILYSTRGNTTDIDEESRSLLQKHKSCIVSTSICERLCHYREMTGEEHSLLLSTGIPSKSSGTFEKSFSDRDFHRQNIIRLYYTSILQPL